MNPDFGFEYVTSEAKRPPALTFPILFLLHDADGNPSEVLDRVHEFVDPALRIISIRGPIATGGGRYTWFESGSDGLLTREEFGKFVKVLVDSMFDLGEKYSPVISRYYLYGEGLGGLIGLANCLGVAVPPQQHRYDTAGLQIANKYMLIGTTLPQPYREPVDLEDIRTHRLYLGQGIDDVVTPVDTARETVDWLQQSGVKFDYREFPMGHTPSEECIADAMKWIGPITSAIR